MHPTILILFGLGSVLILGVNLKKVLSAVFSTNERETGYLQRAIYSQQNKPGTVQTSSSEEAVAYLAEHVNKQLLPDRVSNSNCLLPEHVPISNCLLPEHVPISNCLLPEHVNKQCTPGNFVRIKKTIHR